MQVNVVKMEIPRREREVPSLQCRIAILYRRHRAAIRSRCLWLLRDAAAAEDATHETFVRVLRHAAQMPPDDEALPWLYQIATNYCLNELRHLRIVAAKENVDVFCQESPSPEDEVSDRDLVRKALAAVPEPVSAVALLHASGLLGGEIAATLGVGRRTVVYRLATFRERASAQLLSVPNGTPAALAASV